MKQKLATGYDYSLGKEVERTMKEWDELIEQAKAHGGRKARLPGGDLLIIDRVLGTCRIVAEVYDY